jgi:mitochondrial fission protein ELM1
MTQITWILTDGKKGTENQCIGLASLLGLNPIIKKITPKFPWSILPAHLWFSPLKGVTGLEGEEKWPDILIAASRSAAPVAKEIRRQSNGRTFTIFLQNPYISPKNFDVVIAPQHDQLNHPNVISTLCPFHCVTPQALTTAYAHYNGLLGNLSSKKIAVLLGGKTRHYQMTPAIMEMYGIQLRNIAKRQPMGYMVTASRRTDEKCFEAFKQGLGSAPRFIWDGMGDNPYMGFLAHADIIIVTADSVSMISEAVSTGKPVYLLKLKGHSKKLDAFHQSLLDKGCIRFFNGKLEQWTYTLPHNTDHIINTLKTLGFKNPK